MPATQSQDERDAERMQQLADELGDAARSAFVRAFNVPEFDLYSSLFEYKRIHQQTRLAIGVWYESISQDGEAIAADRARMIADLITRDRLALVRAAGLAAIVMAP